MRYGTGLLLCLLVSMLGCMRSPEVAPGGLSIDDFEQVALNGFDPQDQALDNNDYTWSMEHFVPDGGEGEGHVYVGTWNRVQQWKGFQEHQAVYPEIRRYRPDISPTTWEKVLDTRELGLSDHERPHGFRIMKAYRNKSDGRLFLYAGGRGETTSLWRSETGEPGSWERFWSVDREGSIRGMAVHHDLLYMAFYNDYAMVDKAAMAEGNAKAEEGEAIILATDGNDVWTVIDDGFGNSNNVGIFTIESFNGWLYAGTHNPKQGAEVWKLAGPEPSAAPVRIIKGGGPRWLNEAAMTMYVFQDHLYVGTQASFLWRMIGGLKASDLLRIDTEDHWETVAGPNSIGGEKSGFGERGNAYVWSMCEHDGWFYVGTYDIITGLTYMLTHPAYLMSMMGIDLKSDSPGEKCLTLAQLAYMQPNSGGDLYKSQDGVHWYCVSVDGFGNHNNYGLRTLESANGRLFVGMANPYDGLEVWASAAAEK